MKRKIRMLIGVLGLGVAVAHSQTNINSWENDLEGWSVVNTTDFSSGGFSTTDGVTDGLYSWAVANTTTHYNWDQQGDSPDLQGPSSTDLTALLANARKVEIDAYARDYFDWGFMVNLCVNQPGGAGNRALTGDPASWTWQASGSQNTCAFTVTPSVRAALKANPSLPSSLSICLGAGNTNAATAFFDYLRISPLQLIASWENDLEGWTVVNTNDFTSVGFSTTDGVTTGKYSWGVQNTTTHYNWDQQGDSPDLKGPSSTELTAMLTRAASVTIDVYARDFFDWGFMVNICVNQPGGAGNMSITGDPAVWTWQASGTSQTCTFTVPQSVRTALLNNSSLPCSLSICLGAGNTNAATVFFDRLWINELPPAPANLWVRELWDDLSGPQIPANVAVSNNTSSVGFDPAAPWAVNPAEVRNCQLMAFRPGFDNEPLAGASTMGLPGTLNRTWGCLVQENNGFSFFPNESQGTFWTAGDFMTRPLDPECYIDFQAEGEYWFSMTIANKPWISTSDPGSLNAQYVVFPASGWGGLGFANGTTTNADFVAIGVSGLDVHYGPTNVSYPYGETNASKALYVSQGKLGQPGNVDTTLSANTNLYTGGVSFTNEPYSHTNFSGGPYHINALAQQTVGLLSGDYIVLLGRLRTFGDGTATVDAKYYGTGLGGQPWNTELDTNSATITWDVSYSFNFSGTMTRMLLFQNGQFPFYIFGFRASTNLTRVVGLDPGYIKVAPLANTYAGYSINMTNLAVEANSWSWATPPPGYGSLTNQWYKDGGPIGGATERYYNIAAASLTDAGTYSCVATDPSGTWGSVTNSVVISVTDLGNPQLLSVRTLQNQDTFVLTFDQPNLTGVNDLANYVFDGGIVVSNVGVLDNSITTEVQLRTSHLPLGTKLSLTVSGVTNILGKTLVTTNVAVWTDLIQTGVANWDAWMYPYPAITSQNDYFNVFVPANPKPYVLQSWSRTSFAGPTDGITIFNGGYFGDRFGSILYGWFIPPVTTNYVFYISCDDGGRLSLSTNDSREGLCVIACESLWAGPNQWTNICNNNPPQPHRGDGTANGAGAPSGYVWDNSVVGQSPATACLQNRSDQFIVAYYDSAGLPGGPPGATNYWTSVASFVSDCVPPGMTNFWPNVDANGQALITLQAGQMYYMELEHMEMGGGQNGEVTYKIAGEPDPFSSSTDAAAATIMTGSVIAGTVPFAPTISIAQTVSGPVITYTGVLLAGTELDGITNVVAQSSGSTAISLGGPSQYSPTVTGTSMFYRTRE
jgi:hypothetical protein